MKKVNRIIFNILTFGGFHFWVKNKASKNSELKISSKIDFPVEKLISALGGKENIISTSATISTVKFVLKDNTKIDKECIDSLKVSGTIIGNKNITLVTGDNAQKIGEEIQKKLH